MERYESYKDSGVKWIGEIPGHWEVKRFRFLFSENKSKNTKLKVTKQLQFNYGEIVPKERQDVDNESVKIISNYTIVREKDIMINGLNLNYDFVSQRVAMVRESGIITSAYISLRSMDNVNSNYYNYFLKAMDFRKMFHGMGSGIRLTLAFENLKNLSFPYPSYNEQTAIANYLDSVTSKIDEAISQQQKMIDLLNERKQIIIQNAVTKGLDPNTKMKDSGVEWIGEIPEDWGMNKLKYLFKLNKKKNVGNKCNTILSLSYGKIKIKKDLNEGLSPESYEGYQLLNEGDIVIRSTDLQNDHTSLRTGLVKCEGAITNAYIGLKNLDIKKYDSRYYHYFLHDWDISKAIYNQGKGLRQSLNWDDIKNMLLPVLDINEQTAIANYLDTITSKIDATISQQQKMIGLLNERKQIIINDVVTGKVKVV